MSTPHRKHFEQINELKKLWDFEVQRFKIFDEKAMHIATSSATILTLYMVVLGLTLTYVNIVHIFLSVICIILSGIVLTIFALSIHNALSCLKTKKIDVIHPEKYLKFYAEKSLSYYVKTYCDVLVESIKENMKLNYDKAQNVNCAINYFWYGILSLVFYILVTINSVVFS